MLLLTDEVGWRSDCSTAVVFGNCVCAFGVQGHVLLSRYVCESECVYRM